MEHRAVLSEFDFQDHLTKDNVKSAKKREDSQRTLTHPVADGTFEKPDVAMDRLQPQKKPFL